VLNLKGNRIESLAGIEKLLSLERLDLRENRIRDPVELARLTGMPDFREVYVTRNPLVKTHLDYRVTIFNLFRTSPGYTEDVLVDASGPGYSERRQLVDRVQEHVGRPVARAAHEEEMQDEPVTHVEPMPESEQGSKTQSSASYNEDITKSQRRRKPPRRRIVDISQTETEHRASTQAEDHNTDSSTTLRAERGIPRRSDAQEIQQPAAESRNSRDEVVDRPPPVPAMQHDVEHEHEEAVERPEVLSDLSVDSELYKRKIQALKNDIGHGWLSALGEETRENHFVTPNPKFREKEGAPRLHSPAVSS